jgi:heme exporter protein B
VSPAATLLRKDLLLELRAKQSVPSMALFAVTTMVVFHFALDRNEVSGDLAAGVLWVTLLFAATLAVNRLFVAEREEGGFDGFLLAPVDRTAMLFAKTGTMLVFLVLLELIAIPAYAILLLGPSPWDGLPGLIAVLALADVGIALVGTLVGALAVQARGRELLVPLLSLPLLLPILIGATNATAPLFEVGGAESLPGRWLAVMALYDVVFGLLAYAVFDFLLED